MKYRLFILIASLTVLLISLPATSAQSDFDGLRFWVDHSLLHMILLDGDGNEIDTVSVWDLFNRSYVRQVTISGGGRLLAIAADPDIFITNAPLENFFIYDTESDQFRFSMQVEQTQNISVMFEGDDLLAVGHQSDYDGDGSWTIDVIDLSTYQITHTLTSGQLPDFVAQDDFSSHGGSPNLHSFSRGEIRFNAVDNKRKWRYFNWRLADDYITPDLAFPQTYGAVAQPITGEIAFPMIDDRLPFLVIPGESWDTYPYYPYNYFNEGNTIHIYNPRTDTQFPVFNLSDRAIQHVMWVQNGERLLVAVGRRDGTTPQWMLVDRDGTLIGTLFRGIVDNYNELVPTRDGFIIHAGSAGLDLADLTTGEFIEDEYNNVGEVYAYNTRTLSYRKLPVTGASILWANQDFDADEPPPFTPILPAVPVTAPIENTLQLSVNGAAYLTLDPSELLNLRESPSLSANIVDRLQNNQRVLLLESPVEAEDQTWWHVWVDTRRQGWIVQEADGKTTLRPPDITRFQPLTLAEANIGQPPQFAVGMRVRVLTDGLSIRGATGLSANVVTVLLRYAPLNIIGGSYEDDGLRWWRVSTDDGIEGWAADTSVEGEITLTPLTTVLEGG